MSPGRRPGRLAPGHPDGARRSLSGLRAAAEQPAPARSALLRSRAARSAFSCCSMLNDAASPGRRTAVTVRSFVRSAGSMRDEGAADLELAGRPLLMRATRTSASTTVAKKRPAKLSRSPGRSSRRVMKATPLSDTSTIEPSTTSPSTTFWQLYAISRACPPIAVRSACRCCASSLIERARRVTLGQFVVCGTSPTRSRSPTTHGRRSSPWTRARQQAPLADPHPVGRRHQARAGALHRGQLERVALLIGHGHGRGAQPLHSLRHRQPCHCPVIGRRR